MLMLLPPYVTMNNFLNNILLCCSHSRGPSFGFFCFMYMHFSEKSSTYFCFCCPKNEYFFITMNTKGAAVVVFFACCHRHSTPMCIVCYSPTLTFLHELNSILGSRVLSWGCAGGEFVGFWAHYWQQVHNLSFLKQKWCQTIGIQDKRRS
jgi:hypothetical protein